jgi:hypothetical protein
VAIVGLTVLLAVSVGWQMVADGSVRGSISAYFYGPPRDVLVGALIGVGAALIALDARLRAEGVALTAAGLFAVVVGLVPTPLPAARAGGCGRAARCIPGHALDGVVNNVGAALVVGAAGLVAAGYLRLKATRRPGWSLSVAAAIYLVAAVGFLVWRPVFLVAAHGIASACLFVTMITVVLYHARRARERSCPSRLGGANYGRIYRVIASVMIVVAAASAVLVALARTGRAPFFAWQLAVEAAVIVTFLAFWIAQTVQFWHGVVKDT